MKKLLFFVLMLFLTLFSFSQRGGLAITNATRSQQQWELNQKQQDELKRKQWELKRKQNQKDNKTSRELRQLLSAKITPGNCLIKAKNQIFTGVAIQLSASSIAFISLHKYKKDLTAKVAYQKQHLWGTKEPIAKSPKGIYTGCIIMGVVGFGFEISGINQIGKSGILLNENGIGIKVNF